MPLKERGLSRADAGAMHVALIGGTFSGNKGAAAMLESVIANLSRRTSGPVRFDVISIYPRRDRARPLPENVRIVAAPPAQLIILLPPLAALYSLLRMLHLPRKFLLAYRPLRAIAKSAALLDVSGISFVDGRGVTLVYNVACNLPALMLGVPLVKMSQALGPFRSFPNRTAARFILSRARACFARGRETEENLRYLGLTNVMAAADLAFILGEHVPVPPLPSALLDVFPSEGTVIGVCPSQVLASDCERRGIDLVSVLSNVLDRLHEETGARIVIIAHSLLGPEKRSRNNDYHVCASVYGRLAHRESAMLVAEDLTASELRAVIARCTLLVAARFHSMISALCVGVPPLVIAWSHKYREVMNEFGLGRFVLDVRRLDAESLREMTAAALREASETRTAIAANLPRVMASAQTQIDYTAAMLEAIPADIPFGAAAKRLYERFYVGRFKETYLGYGADPTVREGAASGGLVSSLLIDGMGAGKFSGAILGKAAIENERLELRTVVCSNSRAVLDCRTSVYSDWNHARNVTRILAEQEGSFAVVALPCQWKAINRFLEAHPELRGRIALRVALWCGHATDRRLIDDYLELKKLRYEDMTKLYYRKGLWRGETVVELAGGGTRRIPFQSGYGLLQNLYVDCKHRCFSCTDHFGEGSDVSFGDAWLGRLKPSGIKHSMAIAFTDRGVEAMRELEARGGARLAVTAPELAVEAQKRAVVWHTYGSAGRHAAAPLFGLRTPNRSGCRPRWNDAASAIMILAAYRMYSTPLRGLLLRLPWPLSYAYMLVQKALLNF